MPLPPPLPLGGPRAPARNSVPLPAAPACTARTAAAGGLGIRAGLTSADGGGCGRTTPTLRTHDLVLAPPPPPGGAASTPQGNSPCGRHLGSTAGTSRALGNAARAAACAAAYWADTQTSAAPCTPCCESPLGAPERHVSTESAPPVGSRERAGAAAGRPPPATLMPAPTATATGARADGVACPAAPGCCGTQNPGTARRRSPGRSPVPAAALRPTAPGPLRGRAPPAITPAGPAAAAGVPR